MSSGRNVTDRRPGLVLTRKLGDSILVEDGILEVRVVQIRGKQVRLKFIGNVKIDRKEKYEEQSGDEEDGNAET